jgi:imidazolonepropionase-like amidohydrolase
MKRQPLALIVTGLALLGVSIAGSRAPETQPAPKTSSSFAIADVRVFDGERVIPRATVVVKDGLIASVGANGETPAGMPTVDGTGQTLLPGLIDSHTHSWGDALSRALMFGVTTSLDMFTEHRMAAMLREEQTKPGGAATRADLFSAGTLVTAAGGHGTQYGLPIPTIASASDAPAFVDARIAEGSDYIKIVYEGGSSYGRKIPTITPDVLRAVIDAAHRRRKLAIVHISARSTADEAIAAGADGLVHLFANEPPAPEFGARVAQAAAFVIPTLTVIESTTGVPSGASLVKDERLTPYLTADERGGLEAKFPVRAESTQNMKHAFAAVQQLQAAGVPILAGSDAPNPGTAHGASIHRELELLVRAGLTPTAALASATAVPAKAFSLSDRGRIAPGLRADLVLVKGDPTAGITSTRAITGIWKGGVRLERRTAPPVTSAPAAAPAATTGAISNFDGSQVEAAFGRGWMISTDSMMGGKSIANMAIAPGGAQKSAGALEVTGKIEPGAPFPWAGPMFSPGNVPMTPVDLSTFKEIVFWARGDGGEYQLMVFATKLGNVPAAHPFKTEPQWKEFVVPFSAFNVDGSDLRAILFSATAPGPFTFSIDDVRLR